MKNSIIDTRKRPIIPSRVKELREKEKITQEALAEEIEVSPNTISRIERGAMSLSSEIAIKIAKKYGISLDWLFCQGDVMISQQRQKSIDEAFACMQELVDDE